MEYFANLVIRFRVLIIVVTAALTIFFGVSISGITTDDDVMKFLPSDDEDVQLFNRVNDKFGGLDVAIVGIESERLLSAKSIQRIRELTSNISSIDGVYDVLSFADVPDPQPAPDGLRVEPLVTDKVPVKKEELEELKKRILGNENAVDNLISKDGHAAMVLCFLGGNRPPMHIAQDIKNEAKKTLKGEKLYFGGSPFIRLHVAGGTREDLVALIPVVIAVLLLVAFAVFRKPLGVLLALVSVGLAIVWLMGIIALVGKGLTVVGSSLPTIGMAIGAAYSIHILTAYFSGQKKDVNGRIREALKSVGAPVIASSVTTCAGFMSFLAVDVEPLRDFGLHAALAVAFTAILAMTFVPAILSLTSRVPEKMSAGLLSGPLGKVGEFSNKHRRKSLALSVLLGLIFGLGIFRIAPDATLKSFFAKGSEPDRANQFLNKHFGGSVYLQIYFEGNMRSPFVLAEMRKVTEYARGMDEVVKVNSIVDHLVLMNEAMGGRADLPINHRRTAFLYPFLEGTSAINQMISQEKDSSLLQIRLKDLDADSVNRVVSELKKFIQREVPKGIEMVKIGEFTFSSDREEYSLPEQFDDKGKLTKKRVLIPIKEPSGKNELQKWGAFWRAEVAKRVLRIAKKYVKSANEQTLPRVVSLLKKGLEPGKIADGDDLRLEVEKIGEEHIFGEEPIFEEPFEESTAQERVEWDSRKERTLKELNSLVLGHLDLKSVQNALEKALPLTCRRDPEGTSLCAEVLTNALLEIQSKVLSTRLASQVLRELKIADAKEKLREEVAWAITDLYQPVAAIPSDSKGATSVLARVTGQPVITQAFCESTIRNQVKTLCIALVVLTVIIALFFRSLVLALKALFPAVLMLCVAAGIMGFAKIPLDLTTSMIAVIALGIGVDYALHFLWRRQKSSETLVETSKKIGPSIASSAVQVAAGFSVLAISDMVPMQRFGLLVALTMILAAILTFVLLPALGSGDKK